MSAQRIKSSFLNIILLRNSPEGLVAKAVLREEILDCIIDSTTGVPQAGVSLSGGHAARLCSQYDCAAQKSAHHEGAPAPKQKNHTGILT